MLSKRLLCMPCFIAHVALITSWIVTAHATLELTVVWRESETHEPRRESIEVLPSMNARGLKIYMAKIARRSGGSGRSLAELAATLEVRVEDKDHLHLIDLSDPHKDLAWLGISHEDTLHLSF